MSVSAARNAVRQAERELEAARKKQADADKRRARYETEISRLLDRASKATTDSARRRYLAQIKTKEGHLNRARQDLARYIEKIAKAQTKLTAAQAKLRDAERREEEREQRRAVAQEREAARKRREAERKRAAAEAARDRQLNALSDQASQLEQRLLAAERRVAPPEITVLFLAAAPDDQHALRIDRESRAIQKRVRETEFRDSIFFDWRFARRLPDLIQDLNEVKPTVLHFSGHSDEGGLLFEDVAGRTVDLGSDQLGRLLSAAGSSVRLAVFNSCDSAAHARTAVNHVELAIGMNAAINDDAARVFSAQFYNSLGFGHSVAQAFDQAIFQMEAEGVGHGGAPVLAMADGVEPRTVVLVNPDQDDATAPVGPGSDD